MLAFALLVLPDTLFSLHVVDATLVGVRKGLVRISDFLELHLSGLGVILVLVWMILDGKLLESFLYFILGGIFFDAKQLVVVLCFLLLGLLPLLLLLPLVMLLMVMLLSAMLGSSQYGLALASVPIGQ